MNEEEIRNYCLNCINKPCSKGCPLKNDIPAFIHEEDLKEAYKILCKTTLLPAICGKICPFERQCQGSCTRGIKGESVSIGSMEEFIGTNSIKNNFKIPIELDKDLENKEVAVVGGGPSGLTCAGFLARKGVKVTIYERFSELGGILTHGIPDFRLDKEIVKATISKILDLGIEVKLNQTFGKDFKIEDLTCKYDAVFMGIGANIPSKMNIEGENLKGVFGGNTLLESGNHPSYRGKKVAVIGGGNVAMDTARTIKKLGAEKVYIIYRRAEEQMPSEKKEIQDAKNEGIIFLLQTNISRIIGKEKVEKIECVKTKLVQKEGETRLVPIDIKNSNFLMDMDYVVMAIGSKPDESIIKDFDKNERGYIHINKSMQTSNPKVFAGGDIVGGKSTVASAAKSGRDASDNIIKFLKNIK